MRHKESKKTRFILYRVYSIEMSEQLILTKINQRKSKPIRRYMVNTRNVLLSVLKEKVETKL